MLRTPNTSNGETVPTLGLRCHLCPRRSCPGPMEICLSLSPALPSTSRHWAVGHRRAWVWSLEGRSSWDRAGQTGAEPMESDQALDSILSKVCECFFASLTSIYLLSFCDVWYCLVPWEVVMETQPKRPVDPQS